MRVAITFDDGYREDYLNTYPLFKQYKIKGTSFLTTNDIGKEGYLSWDDIKEMADYGWDFQCHTHNHPQLAKLSDEDIKKEFQMVDNEFLRHSLPIPEYTAYPYNSRNNNVKNITSAYRKGARADSTGGDNYEVKSYAIHRYDIASLLNNDAVIKDLVLHTHDVSDKHNGYGITIKELEVLIKLLTKKGYKFFTFKDYMDNKGESIPKTIHQIWMGKNPIPKKCIDSWKTKNPDFKHILWDEEMIRNEHLINEDIFNKYADIEYKGSKMYHGMADVARVEILNKYGGVYVDADTECTQPIAKAEFMKSDFFAGYQQDKIHPIGKKLVATGVIGSMPNHPVLKEYINQIKNCKPSIDAWKDTGPLLFTTVLEKFNYTPLPAYTFYPTTIDGEENQKCENYGNHIWYSHNLSKHSVVIMAAGKATRWNNYLDVPKQMIPVDGEPILKRTIRLLKTMGVTDITVTVPEKGYFGNLGVEEIVGSSKHEMGRFLNALKENAIYLYGDVFFSEDAIRKIVKNDKSPMFFGRPYDGGRNNMYKRGIGTGLMELFAVKFNSELFQKAKELTKRDIDGGAGWNLYVYFTENLKWMPEPTNRELIIRRNKTCPYFTEICDETEDFDTPKDFDIWIKNYQGNTTVSYNIMAHPNRKKLAEKLQKELECDIIWDQDNNVWETRKRCLEHHIKQGCKYGITVQDDVILTDNFKEKAESLISQTGKTGIYNFFYPKRYSAKKIDNAINQKQNYFVGDVYGIKNEICFAFPTSLMQEMIDVCEKSQKRINKKEGDWIMDLRYVIGKKIPTYYSVPSYADHNEEIESIYYDEDNKQKQKIPRQAWWFDGEWKSPEKGIMTSVQYENHGDYYCYKNESFKIKTKEPLTENAMFDIIKMGIEKKVKKYEDEKITLQLYPRAYILFK